MLDYVRWQEERRGGRRPAAGGGQPDEELKTKTLQLGNYIIQPLVHWRMTIPNAVRSDRGTCKRLSSHFFPSSSPAQKMFAQVASVYLQPLSFDHDGNPLECRTQLEGTPCPQPPSSHHLDSSNQLSEGQITQLLNSSPPM